jgi:hypothetical protein
MDDVTLAEPRHIGREGLASQHKSEEINVKRLAPMVDRGFGNPPRYRDARALYQPMRDCPVEARSRPDPSLRMADIAHDHHDAMAAICKVLLGLGYA